MCRTLALVWMVALASPSAFATTILRVDVDRASSVETQSGWSSLPVDESGDGSTTFPTSLGNVKITVAGVGTRNRNDIVGDPLSNVNEDFSFADGSGASILVTIEGLLAGPYDLTSFHYDPEAGAINTSLFDLTVTDAFGTRQVRDGAPWLLTGHTYSVLFSGSPITLLITPDNSADPAILRTRFNGLIITQTPEPTSVAMWLILGLSLTGLAYFCVRLK